MSRSHTRQRKMARKKAYNNQRTKLVQTEQRKQAEQERYK